jgi:hypothetical protein
LRAGRPGVSRVIVSTRLFNFMAIP